MLLKILIFFTSRYPKDDYANDENNNNDEYDEYESPKQSTNTRPFRIELDFEGYRRDGEYQSEKKVSPLRFHSSFSGFLHLIVQAYLPFRSMQRLQSM